MKVQVDGPELRSPRPALLSSPPLAAALVVTLGALAEAWSSLGPARIFSAPPSDEADTPSAAMNPTTEDMKVGEAEITSESRSRPPPGTSGSAPPQARGPIGGQEEPLDLPAIEAEEPPLPIVDPTGESLNDFFEALLKTQNDEEDAITRIAHFGDSMTVSDYVSSTLREKLQTTFGDAGHGFMLTANAWPSYFHNDVHRFATSGFRVSRIVGPTTKDGMYGLGGVTFRSYSGVRAQYGTVDEGELGRKVSKFTVSYLERPHGGTLALEVDGEHRATIDTSGPKKVVKRHTIEVPDGPHQFELIAKSGETRTFGVVMERDVSGVVLDALGVQGARIRFLDKQDDAHFASELQWRDPDLIAYQFGANESGDGYAYPMDEYLKTMKDVIAQAQEAVPDSSCLIIGAMDRARRRDGVTSSMRIIQLIVKEQRRAAEQLGCAYFDTYNSMGGWGSMPAWVRRGLGQADMTHPTGVGAQRIGNWIYRALMQRYDEFLEEKKAEQ